MVRAFIGLGSNLGDREATLHSAVRSLERLPRTRVVGVSSFRETEPVGVAGGPMFLNGAAEVETALEPAELLAALLAIERRHGRRRAGAGAVQGAPRTLDLDLLLYGTAKIEAPGLVLPHPRLHERAFVLEPLAELDMALEVPGKGRVQALLSKLNSGR